MIGKVFDLKNRRLSLDWEKNSIIELARNKDYCLISFTFIVGNSSFYALIPLLTRIQSVIALHMCSKLVEPLQRENPKCKCPILNLIAFQSVTPQDGTMTQIITFFFDQLWQNRYLKQHSGFPKIFFFFHWTK